MQRHERLKHAEQAASACEAELRKLLERQSALKAELDQFTRALALLRARASALRAPEHERDRNAQGACA